MVERGTLWDGRNPSVTVSRGEVARVVGTRWGEDKYGGRWLSRHKGRVCKVSKEGLDTLWALGGYRMSYPRVKGFQVK